MSSTRPKLQLDEQSFQGLLAAAFTIQEHAELLKQVIEVNPPAAPEPVEEAQRVCPHCAAPLKEDESLCGQCGLEEFRQGERMQRKFASLWEMSQDHGVRQERPAKHGEESVLELASSGLVVSSEAANQSPAPPATQPDALQEETRQEELPRVEVEQPLHSIPLTITEDDSVPEAVENNWLTKADKPRLGAWSLDELRQHLSRHRADLYLGTAIVVAFLALLWPTPAAPQKPHLTPWERVLVNLGIAEAPAPQIHYQGDPKIQVWVDPHTALYYCAGDEQFGKTRDGRLSSQRDAQADQFEPASRAACN